MCVYLKSIEIYICTYTPKRYSKYIVCECDYFIIYCAIHFITYICFIYLYQSMTITQKLETYMLLVHTFIFYNPPLYKFLLSAFITVYFLFIYIFFSSCFEARLYFLIVAKLGFVLGLDWWGGVITKYF